MNKQINWGMLRRIMGALLELEALFMLIPVATGLFYNEGDWLVFAITAAATGIVGALLAGRHVATRRIGRREGFLLTAMVWVVFSFFGLAPFMFCAGLNFSSAFFEAMSAFTTTGATTMDIAGNPPSHCILIWQALMQWLGGMGIILFTLAIIPPLNSSGGVQMFNAEVTGVTHDKLLPRISQTAMMLWGVYLSLTLLLVALLWAGPMSLFDSVCHAFGTMSTGGFSTRPGGVSDFNSDYVTVVITLFMLLGGINLASISRVLLRRRYSLRRDEVLRIYLICIVVFSSLFIASRAITGDVYDLRSGLLEPVFQVVSTITSTGYVAAGFKVFAPFLLALTFIMMFSGGCAGSTSGGAKIDRMIYLAKYLRNELRLAVHPNRIPSVKINSTVVNPAVVSKVVAFLCLYFVCITVGGILLSMMGLPAVDSFFSSFACISNTGFGASVTGYGDDYMIIPDMAKWILAALMLIGRLEIYTVLVLLTPAFWFRRG